MQKYPDLKGANSQVAEQTFRWLAGYKHITKHMNQGRYNMLLLRMCHLHNMNLNRKLVVPNDENGDEEEDGETIVREQRD